MRTGRALVLTALCLGLLAGVVQAGDPVALPGTQWDLDLKLKAKVKGVGNEKGGGQGAVEFTDTDFTFTDEDGDSFTGTYDVDAKGRAQLTPAPGSIAAWLEGKMNDAVAFIPGVTVNDVTVGQIKKSEVKSKASKKADKLDLKVQFEATVDLTVDDDGQPENVVADVKFDIKGKAERPAQGGGGGDDGAAVAGTQWNCFADRSMKIKGLGKEDASGDCTVFFGPNPAEGLGETEFKVETPDGDLVGTYTADDKGKVEFNFDVAVLQGMLQAFVEDVLEDSFWTVDAVDLDVDSVKAKGKVKNGELKFDMKVKWEGSAVLDGEYGEGKGDYKVKGEGAEAP